MESVYLEHFARYPLMLPQDAVKLAYQSEFGGGHMIPDAQKSLARLTEELAATPQNGGEPLERIGGGLARFRLSAFQESGLQPETLNGLFVSTANRRRGSAEGLRSRLLTLSALADAGQAPFSPDALRLYLSQYRLAGWPVVSHTPEYRAAYAPSYRLVPGQTRALFPLLRRIDALIREKGCVRVSIDGMSGSGKSTLGALLSDVYGASLFHMDDYFLPPDRKTPERLSEPGGNVDWERFFEEISSRGMGEEIAYRPYDCSAGTLLQPVCVEPKPVRVVEGSYSLRAPLYDACDVRVFLYIDPEEQAKRILVRNGPVMQKRFLTEWIPLENAHIAHANLLKRCDFALDTTHLPL